MLTSPHSHKILLVFPHILTPSHAHILTLSPPPEERVEESGPLEPDKVDVREEPYSLSDKFVWDEVDLTSEAQIAELHELLNENYVEDEDNMFR